MAAPEKSLGSFVTEKKVGMGEDAPPISRNYKDLGDVVAVFDGMGGSGATQVPVDSTITAMAEGKCSMAYIASRVVSRTVEQVLGQLGSSNLPKLKSQVEAAVKAELVKLAERPDGKGPEPRLRGTILAEYPTTVAIAVVRPSADEFNRRQVNVYWAGDSRIYALIPDPDQTIPLQLLTRDHSDFGEGGDAPLERYACTKGLDLEESEYSLPPSSAVIAMSDGCFAYMSPFRLLFLLIQEIRFARNIDEWIDAIKTKISSIAGDDCSFAISLGEGGFDALRERVADVYSELEPLMYVPQDIKPNRYVLTHQESMFEELFDETRNRRLKASTPPLLPPTLASDETPVFLEVKPKDTDLKPEV